MASGSRRQGRELALKIIYSFPDQPGGIDQILLGFWRNFRFDNDVLGDAVDETDESIAPEVRSFSEQIACGAHADLDRIDACIKRYSANWSLERMSRVDLALLRLGTYELLSSPETPPSVVINEAIEIGKRYGTKETPAFVNGILDKIAKIERS
jgi:transcription antitermination protein NusB